MVTYLVPVFAVVFGVTILGEPLSWHEPAGGALIILGVALAQGGPPRAPTLYPLTRFQERCRSG